VIQIGSGIKDRQGGNHVSDAYMAIFVFVLMLASAIGIGYGITTLLEGGLYIKDQITTEITERKTKNIKEK